MTVRAVEPQTLLTLKEVVWECIQVQKDYLEDVRRSDLSYLTPQRSRALTP